MKVSREKVIEDLRELFQIDKNRGFGTFELRGKFRISKRQLGRVEVIGMLHDYFSDKTIITGCLEIGDITFVYTSFKIVDLSCMIE